jgi:hypothetical protein
MALKNWGGGIFDFKHSESKIIKQLKSKEE